MISRTRRAVLGAAAGGALLLGGGAGVVQLRRYLRQPRLDKVAPEYEGPEASLAEVLEAPRFDVCIVGSGFAGTALGTLLARAGMRTLVVEGGVIPSRMAKNEKYALINQATMSGDQPYAVQATRAMMPGGTSALWTGNSPRLLPIDFEPNAYTPPGTGWPIRYSQLNDYYEKAEDMLLVTGESNVRSLPPRPHPLHNERRGGNRALKAMLNDAGVAAFDTFRSLTPRGGPVRVARDMLPGYAKTPGAVLLTGTSARRLIGSSPDRIDALFVKDIDGNSALIRARAFVVAAGGVESARLLLLSQSEQFPHGLGNWTDQVGRTFDDHLYLNFTSRVADPHILLGGPVPQIVRSFQYYETFKKRGLGSLGLTVSLRHTDTEEMELRMTAECELQPSDSNRVTLDETTLDPWGDPVAHLHFSATDRDREMRKESSAAVIALMAKMGAHDIDEWPQHWGHHHLGTVRMGSDPRTSVVDSDLAVHGVRNAFVLSSGNFVTSGPANPTLLIVAFAHRLADHLTQIMHEGAFEMPLTRLKQAQAQG
jgi:glucose dehydrogenase